MTTKEIAAQLAAFCQKGQFEQAQKALYADNVVSVEPYATQAFEKETSGLANVIDKGRKFEEMTEQLHETKVSEPLITDHTIAFVLTMDITMKGKERTTWNELCVYQVKEGKIIHEQFYM